MREYINIKNVGNNNGEILNKFNWDLEFTPPAALLSPDMQIFKTRLITVSGLPGETSHTIDEVEVGGGFSVIQVGESERKPVDVQFEFQDYDDEILSNYFLNWNNAQTNPINKVSDYKRNLICQAVVYQLTTGLQPIKRWDLLNGLLVTQNTNDSDFSNKKELNGKLNITIKFEWWNVSYDTTNMAINNAANLAGIVPTITGSGSTLNRVVNAVNTVSSVGGIVSSAARVVSNVL